MTTYAHPNDAAERDRAAIAATLQRLAEAWNAGDAAAYGAEFTEDASYVAFNGEIMRGRTEIEQVHRWLFDGPLRGSRMQSGGDPSTSAPPRIIRPGVAVMQQGGGIRPEGATELADDRASLATLVLVEEDQGDWRITAFHNTRRQPTERTPEEA
ncbi:SgcJ/EcaC family oxidoreductase [Halostreptopolyspora alba]|uniref:SgcJ/EcaC family oxidoreductase n=1 Tax=Halostreptopolyspora alba TaxID=2487137 RepID=A0A3N0EGB2_9ACTN|nr:SgcJ/EcaC family oxidoreductase [Nocardiopsaceae bacterium YIM 96095]